MLQVSISVDEAQQSEVTLEVTAVETTQDVTESKVTEQVSEVQPETTVLSEIMMAPGEELKPDEITFEISTVEVETKKESQVCLYITTGLV